ncbi:MAG: hypothetical protein DIU68_007160 [Chloroflexota bacterium]|nr:MAG: hypothetical protein DIU68_02345 [Chloroflexota bacterium]
MSRSLRLLVTLMMLLALATTFTVFAQEATEEADQGTTEQQDATVEETTQTTTTQQQVTGSQQPNGLPTGATLIDIVELTGFDTYTFDLSVIGGTGVRRAQAGQFSLLGSLTQQLSAQDVELQQSPSDGQLESCGNIRVYKVSSQGSQDLWPNVGCAGDLLVIQAGGTGDYIVYRFNTPQAAAGALPSMPLCPGAVADEDEAEDDAATATPAPSVTCFWIAAQNQLAAQAAQQEAAAQPEETTADDTAAEDTGSEDAEATETPEG